MCGGQEEDGKATVCACHFDIAGSKQQWANIEGKLEKGKTKKGRKITKREYLQACLQKQFDPTWVQTSPQQSKENRTVNSMTTTTIAAGNVKQESVGERGRKIYFADLLVQTARLQMFFCSYVFRPFQSVLEDQQKYTKVGETAEKPLRSNVSFDAIAEAVRILQEASRMLDDCLHRIGGSSSGSELKWNLEILKAVELPANGMFAASTATTTTAQNEWQKQQSQQKLSVVYANTVDALEKKAQQNGRPKCLLLSGGISFPSELRKYKKPTATS